MNKTEKTVKVILKSSKGHTRSRSTPHVRIVTTTNPTLPPERISSNDTEMSTEANEIYINYLKKFDVLLEKKLPALDIRKHEYIYQRRVNEPIIYTERKRVLHQPVPIVNGGSALVITHDAKGDEYLKRDMKAGVSKRSKLILKWNTFKWLVEHKKDIINVLWKNYYALIRLIRKKGHPITKLEFCDFFMNLGLRKDKLVIEKVFWVLDNDNNGEIELRELITGLEFFREETFEDKMQIFFEICDADGSGTLSQDEVFNVLKKNVVTKQDKLHLKRIIDCFFQEADLDDNGEIEKKELLKAASTSQELKKVLNESIKMIRTVDKYINSNFQEAFQEWLPGGFMVNAKEGIHHPGVSKFVSMLKESEEAWQQSTTLKKSFRDEFQKVKNSQGIEVDTEEYGVL